VGSSYGAYLRMDDAERIKRWICALCGKRYVVTSLARDCEEKHLQSEYES
jgi:hypothetical protein